MNRETKAGSLVAVLLLLNFVMAWSYFTLSNRIYQAPVEEKAELEKVIPENINNVPNVIQYTPKEIELIAKMVYAEAKGERFEGQVAVAKVIFNRVNHPQYPNTVEEVLYQKGQFSPIANGTFSRAKPTEVHYKAVLQAIDGGLDGALFFFNPKTSDPSNVRWFRNSTKYIKTIGNHEFRGY